MKTAFNGCALATVAMVVGACQMPFTSSAEPPRRISAPQPLPAAPSSPVAQAALPPPGASAGASMSATGAMGAGDLTSTTAATGDVGASAQLAALAPAPQSAEVGRSDVLGGWTISSAGTSCKLFTSLTSWSGGYRAVTNGCDSPTLGGIEAWDLVGQQVVLKDGGGETVARLTAASKTQFSGQTTSGAPVSFTR